MVFLKLNDSTFSAATYPKLALVWPGLKLTDTRGEFIRIWDDGRGVDSNRELLSSQLDALQQMTGSARNGAVTGFINTSDANNTSGVFKRGAEYAYTAQNTNSAKGADLVFDASLVARTASETRPRNIAFNLLVRAK
ncbi:phage tail protein [Escherichia coli]